MSIELIPPKEPEYRITNRPGYEEAIFTDSSKDWLALPEAAKFAQAREATLQSLIDAAVFRMEAKGKYDANRYHISSTPVVYFKDGSKFYLAVDHAAAPSENLILTRAQEGYDAHTATGSWLHAKTAPSMRALLARVTPVEVTESPLELATKPAKGTSAFGSHPITQALLPDIAEEYAGFLKNNGYSTGYLYTLTPERLEGLKIGDQVEVRAAGLGGDVDDFNNVGAHQHFYVGGRARGVRRAREISTGNEGRLERAANQ